MKPYPFDESKGDFNELHFQSDDLYECLDHFETKGDIEPLRSAIAFVEGKKRATRTRIESLVEFSIQTNHVFLKNALIIIQKNL